VKKLLLYSFFAALVLTVIFTALSYRFAVQFTEPHNTEIGNLPDSLSSKFNSVYFKTKDSLLLNGWYAAPDTGSSAVILLHGYRSNRLEMMPRALMFMKYGFGALVYDARACGESEGNHISFGYYEKNDLLAATDFLKKTGIKHIGLDGFSQGGATIVLAGDSFPQEVKFAIIESTYPSLRSAIDTRFRKYLYIPGCAGGLIMIPIAESIINADIDDIAPVNVIGKLKVPLLIMAGGNDSRLKTSDAYMLLEAAGSNSDWHIIRGAEHEDLYLFNKNEYEAEVIEFVLKNFIKR
jgi:pimeloyl-ACP methyl ester carboxylesterase